MAFPLTPDEMRDVEFMIESPTEIIIAAAIRHDGIIWSVERPGRHGDIINPMHHLGLDYMDQGFITNHGRFVDRLEAGRIAERSGQGTTREICNRHLFSEDLW